MTLILKGARIIDPSQNLDEILDILIENDKIAQIGKNLNISDAKIINLENHIITPGLIDIHTHLREPGYEYKEDIKSGSSSAIAGGFTTICCMPNTNPPLDNAALIKYVKDQGIEANKARVLPIGCVSKGQKGKEMAELGDMANAGAVAFSDDGKPVYDSSLMRKAMLYAQMFDKIIIDHCEEQNLSHLGHVNEGKISVQMGIEGIPSSAEDTMVARNILIAKELDCPVHIAHVSTKTSVELLYQAKAQGIKVSAEATPQHLLLTEEAVKGYNTMAKVNPPLRTNEDVKALQKALADGIIDIIATDHAPHHFDEKDVEFDKAAFGMVGLETALGLVLTHLVGTGKLSLSDMVERMSTAPARLLGLNLGTLAPESPADITVIDPELSWTVDPDKFYSKGKNTPFKDCKLTGKAVMTIVNGKIVSP